jgi:hypothetical protein
VGPRINVWGHALLTLLSPPFTFAHPYTYTLSRQTLEASVVPALSAMSSDEDPDVKYFASKALQGCMQAAG